MNNRGASQINYPDLNSWWSTGLGQQVLNQEKRRLDELLPHLNGTKLLCLGDVLLPQLLNQSQVPLQIWGSENRLQRLNNPCSLSLLPSSYQFLPLPSAETDVAVVHHILEHSDAANAVLRELTRVIKPYGYLLLLSFNNHSTWGLRSLSARLFRRKNYPWHLNYWSTGRLNNALDLLGFEIQQQYSFAYHLPIGVKGARLADRALSNWQGYGGAVNLVLAQKNVRGITPIKPLWRRQSSLQAASIRQTITVAQTDGD